MFSEDKYDFINAKVHGMKSKLYQGDKLIELLSARSMVELLREIYPEQLKDTPPKPGLVEKKLVEGYLDSLITIKNALTGKEEAFIGALIQRYQVENLKVILQFWEKRRREDKEVKDILDAVEFFMIPKVGNLPIVQLLEAPDFSSFYHAIPLENYRKAVEKASRFYYRTQNIFFVELVLDLEYLKMLWKTINKLGKGDREIAREIYGTEMDWHILSWIWRLKKNYNLPLEQLTELFDFDAHHLKRKTLKNIIHQSAFEECLKKCPIHYRLSFLKGMEDENNTMDDFMWTSIYKEARKLFPMNLFNLGLIICFTVFKRVEIMNLIRLIQGMKYELPKARIKKSFIPLGDWED